MCYTSVFMGAVSVLALTGKFVLHIADSESILAFIGHTFFGVLMLTIIVIMGLLIVALIEQLFGDENSAFHKKIMKALNDTFPIL